MASFLLDSNHASPLVTAHHPLRKRFASALHAGDTFAVPVPVITETMLGIALAPRAAQNLREWNRLLQVLNLYPLDATDAMRAAELQLQLRRRGWQLLTVDALIAAVALRYGLTLLTTDTDFTPVPGLPQQNWINP